MKSIDNTSTKKEVVELFSEEIHAMWEEGLELEELDFYFEDKIKGIKEFNKKIFSTPGSYRKQLN